MEHKLATSSQPYALKAHQTDSIKFAKWKRKLNHKNSDLIKLSETRIIISSFPTYNRPETIYGKHHSIWKRWAALMQLRTIFLNHPSLSQLQRKMIPLFNNVFKYKLLYSLSIIIKQHRMLCRELLLKLILLNLNLTHTKSDNNKMKDSNLLKIQRLRSKNHPLLRYCKMMGESCLFRNSWILIASHKRNEREEDPLWDNCLMILK